MRNRHVSLERTVRSVLASEGVDLDLIVALSLRSPLAGANDQRHAREVPSTSAVFDDRLLRPRQGDESLY